MIDIHAPEHTPHSWRDFFIHIATIVVGLLIAIGLEQSVEWAHHRKEVRETREALAREREHNRKRVAADSDYIAIKMAQLKNNILVLRYLQQHPGTPEENLPGILMWGNFHTPFDTSAWETAKQSGITAYMPQDEATADQQIYQFFDNIEKTSMDVWKATSRALAYRGADPDPTHFTPTQIQREIEMTHEIMGAEYRYAVLLLNLGESYKDFKGAPTRADIDTFMTTPERQANPQKLAAAHALSEARMPPPSPNSHFAR